MGHEVRGSGDLGVVCDPPWRRHDRLVVGRKFKGNLELLLAALGEHLETGEDIARGWKAPAA